MGKRFLHNRAAVVTVAFVLLIALIGILAPLLAPHDPMLRTSSTNSRRTAWNIRWGLITWGGVCSPA